MSGDHQRRATAGSVGEVFFAFLKLGLTSFGGPIAHIGYFRKEFVERRRWLAEHAFAEIVAICQFLPGPTSSQTGMALGFQRAGRLGALAAWTGFTLPSALIMAAFAVFATQTQGPGLSGLAHGLKLVAVAVVADALVGMARSLTPDLPRAGIALLAFLVAVVAPAMIGQVAAIALGAFLGIWLTRTAQAPPPVPFPSMSRRTGALLLMAFVLLLVGGPLLRPMAQSELVRGFDAFFGPGALVFGGGHVVLPLLKETTVAPGLVSEEVFLAGYGAAQAVPGPLFTFATYLGIVMPPPLGGVLGGLIATLAIFLPGALILFGVLPFWSAVRAQRRLRAAVTGAGAAVVGVLAAAFRDPIWSSGVHSALDLMAALVGFVLLVRFRAPPILIVILGVAWGLAVRHLPVG